MRGEGGCRVGEVRAGTTFPMPDHKGFKLQSTYPISKWIFRNLALWGLILYYVVLAVGDSGYVNMYGDSMWFCEP